MLNRLFNQASGHWNTANYKKAVDLARTHNFSVTSN